MNKSEEKKRQQQKYYVLIAEYNEKQRQLMKLQSEMRLIAAELSELNRRMKEDERH